MLEVFFNFLKEIGIIGLFAAMAIKGSTFPLPSFIVILSYGYILNPSTFEMIWIAVGMSLVFSIASLIPYHLGTRLEKYVKSKHKKKLELAQYFFKKYGEWSVAITRPFTIGMYISYVAGMGQVRILKYGILTFLGILPWSFFILYISKALKGNVNLMMEIISRYTLPLVILLSLAVIVYFFVLKGLKRIRIRE